jgi:hypothetical protein
VNTLTNKQDNTLKPLRYRDLSHKYVGQVKSIFKNLPKPLKWKSFLMHDLILLTDIPLKVQKASIKLDLNKAKI